MERDHRKLICPHCAEQGSVYVDPASASFRCRKCRAGGFDPYTDQPPANAVKALATGTMPQRKKRRVLEPGRVKADPRPPIPQGTINAHIVEDYYIPYTEKGFVFTQVPGASKTMVSRVYCPKELVTNENEQFDPTTKDAQCYMRIYAKRFKNRRRYNRDLARRAKEEQDDNATD